MSCCSLSAALLLCLSSRVLRKYACRHPQEVKRYEEQRKGNKSTYWVIFELTWRDYYRYFTMRSGNAIFMEYGITNKKVSASPVWTFALVFAAASSNRQCGWTPSE